MASETGSQLKRVMARYRSAIPALAVFSGIINVLTLTSSLFMLTVYDRVLPSRSVPTLVGLALFAALLYAFHGLLEVLRSRILSRIGTGLEDALGGRLFTLMVMRSNSGTPGVDAMGPLRDLETLRTFSASPGPGALFDLPWIPVYLALCFAFHPLIGYTATAGALLLIALTLLTDALTRAASRRLHAGRERKNEFADECRRNAEAVQAMAMSPSLGDRWQTMQGPYLAQQQELADTMSSLGTASKIARIMLQSLVLAVGAYLVIDGAATGGIMIAGSILMSRALAPIDLSLGNWRGFVAARQAWARLAAVTRQQPVDAIQLALPLPTRRLELEKVCVSPPATNIVAARDISFGLERGEGLGVIGASGCGKSSLIRSLAGVWPTVRGDIRLDGIRMDNWQQEVLGQTIGYLPQDVELLAGTVAENIARFRDAEPDEILAAARNANVHELIASLPQGYDTPVGPGGRALSAGQRQRVALARAMFRDPFLIILDEPNSNLDAPGEAALGDAIRRARMRGSIVVVVAHRPGILSAVNKLLFIGPAGQTVFGDREAVLQQVVGKPPAARNDALRPVDGTEATSTPRRVAS